ncbi:MAG: glycosyltransferase family 9 protein [Patescibacteria group bacterium]
MDKFYSGLKKFFNLKEQKSRPDQAVSETESAAVEQQLNATAAAIKGRELTPPAVEAKDLPAKQQPDAEAAIGDAAVGLDTAKQDSLNQLDQTKKLVFKAGVVDTSEILRSRAHRAASETMTAEKAELKGFKGAIKRIWKYNYAEQYLHEQARVKSKQEILKTGNLYAGEKSSAADKAAMQQNFETAILSRFTSDIKELVEENLGEKKESLADNPETQKIKTDLKRIINDYADGKLDQAAFEGEKRQIFAAIEKSGDQTTIKQSEMYVDNFLAIAEQVKEIKDNIKQAADHQAKLAAFDFDVELVLGRAKEGVKTETHYNIAEKTVEKLRRTKLGSLVNETTLAVSVGLAYSAGAFVSQRILRSKAAAIGTLGLAAGVSGLYTGIKESQMQKRERQTLEARSAVQDLNIQADRNRLADEIGALENAKQTTTDKKELKKIDKNLKSLQQEKEKLDSQASFIYRKKSAANLHEDLTASLAKAPETAEEMEKALNNLAEIEARLALSNERKIDLISYSGLANVESERQALLQAKWQAKQQLSKLPAGLNQGWEQRLADLTALYRNDLIGDADTGLAVKDKAFNKHRNKEVFKKVAQSTVAGLTIGLVAQEGFALLSDKQEGLAENLIKGNNRAIGDRDTALESLKNFLTGHSNPGKLQEIAVEHGLIKMPANCSWLPNPDGSFNLVRGSEILAEHLQVNPDGSLTEEAKQILANEHIGVSDSQYLIESGHSVTTETHIGPEDYVNKHPEMFKEVRRGLWYANDTPMYQGADGKWHGADLNELRETWAGDKGSGINLQTNSYEMAAIRMTPDGSFETVNGVKLSENAAELIKEGKMKFLFSLSSGTQHQVIEIPVDPTTGKISVERGSELGKLLFGEKDGHAVLKAKFAEVAVSAGLGKDGAENVHVFATAVGEGLKGVDASEVVNTPPDLGTATLLDVGRDTDWPPFIPVGWRTPLEKQKAAEPIEFPSGYYGDYYGYSGSLKKDRQELKLYRGNPSNVDLVALKKILSTDTQAAPEQDAGKKRKPLFITLDNSNYDTSVKLKSDNRELQDYRDQGDKFLKLVETLKQDPKYKKYGFVLDQLRFYVNYDELSEADKTKIAGDCRHYNEQRNSGAPLSAEDYVGLQIGRLQNQIDNIFLSEAKVGDKPFPPEFYKESPLVKGIERAEEIVILLDDPIGDEVVTTPIVLAVERYLEENKFDKPIKLAVSKTGMKLFQCLVDQFPGKVELIELGRRNENEAENFRPLRAAFANDHKEKFIINAHKEFEQYGLLNLDDNDSDDPSHVMSVDWSSWVKEEIPKRRGLTEKYDPIPARIMRNFEVMFGQKLFPDINKMDHYLEKGKDHDKISAELKKKYKVADDENIIVVSAGSGVMPKEYEPAKWALAIKGILKEHPKSKVLFMEDPNKQRQERYNPLVEKLAKDTGRVSLVKEPVENVNAIMSMADVVLTPDTGLGHYAAALGTPDVMLILGDPVRWSNAKTERIIHKKARESYAKNRGTYDRAWTPNSGYYVDDNGELIGSSNLSPDLIIRAAGKHLKK